MLGYAAILIAGLLFCLFVQFKAEHETSMALERYRSLSAEKARNARFVAGSGFEQIYQNLRTIGMLPSVMNIDRHGENIDDDARMSIQQIYNNLASTIDLSEIYIVPADFRPDAVDPVTGAPQEPILMFDELVTAFGRNGEASGDAGVTPQEEVEIEEYRQLETLMATLRRDYPSVDSFEGMNAPFFSSEAVITCDNTEFNHTLNDLDRTGVLFSVPFYGADKALKGSVTAILRLNALRKLLPPRDYALVDPAAGVVVTGAEADQTAASSVRVRAGEADPGLLYSEALPLSVNQRETSWRLWAGHADAGFHESPEMAAIEAGRMAGFGLGGGATLLAMLAWAASRRRRAREQAQWRDLSDAAIEGMAICNGEKIVTANRSFCALLDMKPEEVRGRNFQDLLADQAPAQRLRDADGKPVEAALLGAARDVAVEIMSRRIAYMGKPHRVLSVRDLSERKAAEARESAAREAAETRRREMEQRIGAVISAVAAGDFDKRLDLDTDDAFVVEVANGVNRICGIVGEFTADLTQTMSALAQGDLTRRIEADYAGRFGALANSANSTVDRLDDLVGDIQATTAAMRSATSEIADGATDLSSRAESQASSLEQTAATMEQMAATIKQSAENGDRARDLAGEAASRAGRGGAVVQETVTAMERIEASATRISDIVNVIDSIAFQTNLLALNAAVEAARAGEAGKGFAVVASEVRTLAQRSADAAKDISGLIAESSTHVGEGVDLVRRTGDSLTEIVEAVTQMVGAIEAIAEATREQSTGVEEISSAVGHMDDMTQRNATLADQSATSAKDLSVQAERLAGLVGFFRTRAAAGKPAAPAKRAAAAQEGPAQDGTTKEGRAKRARASKERVREDRADSAWAAAEAQTRAQAQTRDAPRMKANAGEEWLDF